MLMLEHLSNPAVGGGGNAECGNETADTLPLRISGAQEYTPAHWADAVGVEPSTGSPPDVLPIPCVRWVRMTGNVVPQEISTNQCQFSGQ